MGIIPQKIVLQGYYAQNVINDIYMKIIGINNQCNAKQFQQDFPNWTSRNNVQNRYKVLEWIPYRLTNIKYLAKEGFSTVHKAI